MKNKLILAALSTLGIFVISLLIITAIEYKAMETPETECKVVSGIVTEISEGGIKDAVLLLDQNSNKYYINRALESRFTLGDLQQKLKGNEVTIFYSDYKSVFFGDRQTYHIRKLTINEAVLYTEFN